MASSIKIDIQIKEPGFYGKVNRVGIHTRFTNVRDIEDAVESALKDQFSTIFLYNNLTDLRVFKPWIDEHFSLYSSNLNDSGTVLSCYFSDEA